MKKKQLSEGHISNFLNIAQIFNLIYKEKSLYHSSTVRIQKISEGSTEKKSYCSTLANPLLLDFPVDILCMKKPQLLKI